MKKIDFLKIKLVKEKSHTYSRTHNSMVAQELIREIYDTDHMDREYFGILALDAKNKIVGAHLVSIGTITASYSHPREVFKAAILNNAATIVAWHNHPSGDETPSQEDREMSDRLAKAGRTLGIQLLDHIIIGRRPRYFSFADNSLI